MKIESFKEWLEQEEINEQGMTRRRLLSGALTGALGLGLSKAMGANTPAGDPGSVSPEDSIGMIPQIRSWSDKLGTFLKQGHLESLDRGFAYIRFTDTPDQLTKVPRNWLSEEDQDYLSRFEQGRRTPPNAAQGGNNPATAQQPEKKEFNPKFGPKPPLRKNKETGEIIHPTPMQIYKHQVRISIDGADKVNRGRKPPVDYLILYKYYNGIMPDPPTE